MNKLNLTSKKNNLTRSKLKEEFGLTDKQCDEVIKFAEERAKDFRCKLQHELAEMIANSISHEPTD
jgi:hypothetical protein